MSGAEPLAAKLQRVRMAQGAPVPDDAGSAASPGIEPLAEPVGFVDIVFSRADDGAGPLMFVEVLDARGVPMEVGHWLVDDDGGVRLRLPWRTGIPDPIDSVRRPLVHRNGQSTEVTAAALITPPKQKQKLRQVLAYFQNDYRAGGDGLIDDDFESRWQLHRDTAAPRRKELVEMGWVRPTTRTRTNQRGNSCRVWELTPAAVEKMGLRRPRNAESDCADQESGPEDPNAGPAASGPQEQEPGGPGGVEDLAGHVG